MHAWIGSQNGLDNSGETKFVKWNYEVRCRLPILRPPGCGLPFPCLPLLTQRSSDRDAPPQLADDPSGQYAPKGTFNHWAYKVL